MVSLLRAAACPQRGDEQIFDVLAVHGSPVDAGSLECGEDDCRHLPFRGGALGQFTDGRANEAAFGVEIRHVDTRSAAVVEDGNARTIGESVGGNTNLVAIRARSVRAARRIMRRGPEEWAVATSTIPSAPSIILCFRLRRSFAEPPTAVFAPFTKSALSADSPVG